MSTCYHSLQLEYDLNMEDNDCPLKKIADGERSNGELPEEF